MSEYQKFLDMQKRCLETQSLIEILRENNKNARQVQAKLDEVTVEKKLLAREFLIERLHQDLDRIDQIDQLGRREEASKNS